MYVSAIGRIMWHAVGRRLGVLMTWVNKPYSRGRVTLETPIWQDEPRVEMNFFSDPRDLSRLMAGTRFAAGLYDHAALRAVTRDAFSAAYSPRAQRIGVVNARNRMIAAVAGAVMDAPAPIRRAFMRKILTQANHLAAILADDEKLAAHVRRTATGVKHVSCTCRMGGPDDPMAVTDTDGRVRGIAGLRIVDASLFPSVPRANTNIPTIMAAEKIADRIVAAR
jgi:5-(hydroxymethyl)furfural/furfural oxidase